MSDFSQASRQIMIIKILNSYTDGIDMTSIHNILSSYGYTVSKRTIRRDMDTLTKSFLIYEKETRPLLFVLQNATFKNLHISFNDFNAIKFIQELIKPYTHLDIGIYAENLLQSILNSLPQDQKKWIQNTSPLIHINPNEIINEEEYNPETKKVIEKAIIMRQCLTISYYSFYNNTTNTRVVDPHLLEINEGCYHFWAYCHKRRAMRDFRLSRILWVELDSATFERKNKLLKESLKKRFKNMSGQESVLVKLRFSGNSARLVKEYYKKLADRLLECGDGTVVFERNVAITPEIKQWILKFGSEVEVLEPKDLRESIRKTVSDMVGIYEE